MHPDIAPNTTTRKRGCVVLDQRSVSKDPAASAFISSPVCSDAAALGFAIAALRGTVSTMRKATAWISLPRAFAVRHRRRMIFPDLNGQLILVTGGAHGIGSAMIRAFHRQGAHVCFCDVDQRAGRELASTIGEGVRFRAVDLTKEEHICSWLRDIHHLKRPVRALINNAARDPRMELAKTSVKIWDELHALNLRAYFLTCRETVPLMKAGSAIVNLASITFHQGPSPMTSYVATKGGVIGFTRALARELGPKRIRVNTLSPGWVMTERQLKEHVRPSTKALIRRAQCVPDLLQPDEIADVALFLASNASRAITGQEILADLGWYHS